MSKSNVMISLESDLYEKAKKELKGKVSSICEDALRKELNIQEEAPSELLQLQQLIEIKRKVQDLALLEGGDSAIKIVAHKIKKEEHFNPETPEERIKFWTRIFDEVKLKLIRQKLNPEKEK
jgi:hypothetical protein